MRLDIDFEHLGVAGQATWTDGKWATTDPDLDECIKAAAKAKPWTRCGPQGPSVQQGTKTLESFYCTVRDWTDPGGFHAMAPGYQQAAAEPGELDGGPILALETLGDRLARRTTAAMR